MNRLVSLLFGGILLLLANSEGAPEVPKAGHHREYKLKDWMSTDDYLTTESATTYTDDYTTEPATTSTDDYITEPATSTDDYTTGLATSSTDDYTTEPATSTDDTEPPSSSPTTTLTTTSSTTTTTPPTTTPSSSSSTTTTITSSSTTPPPPPTTSSPTTTTTTTTSSSSSAASSTAQATTTTASYSYSINASYKNCSYGGGSIYNNTGVIKVGSRKGHYFNNEYCFWYITVTEGMVVRLKWKWFGLEGPSPSCPYDYVKVIDPATGTSLTGLLCGYQRPSVVYTSNNTALVVFNTDYSITDIGFKAKYRASLGGGKFKVGSKNGKYSNNMNEEWTFHLPAGANGIRIKWKLFKIESHFSCSWDYVQFVDLATSAILGTYCGNTDPGTLIYYTSIKAKFVSDGSVRKKGFIAKYEFF